MSRTAKVAIGLVVAIAVVGFGAWWFLRDTAPDELSVDDVDAGGSSDAAAGGDDLDGTWTVVAGADTQAGLRIDEEFVGGAATHTAVGRTPDVEGTVEIVGTEVGSAEFTVDLTALEWSDSPGFPTGNRTNAIRDQGIETGRFPDATFALTAPVSFDAPPSGDEAVTVEVTGDLTLHGVTNEVTFSIDARRSGDDLVVATAQPVPVVLADYDIDEPSSPSVASIADQGSFEFLVVLARS